MLLNTLMINVDISYTSTVFPNLGELETLIDWCRNNCVGDFAFTESSDTSVFGYTFFFEREQDYIIFLLTHT